jgi:hypothetical protein
LLNEVEKIFNDTKISKLDIKRVYRYLDKNVKKVTAASRRAAAVGMNDDEDDDDADFEIDDDDCGED